MHLYLEVCECKKDQCCDCEKKKWNNEKKAFFQGYRSYYEPHIVLPDFLPPHTRLVPLKSVSML